MSSEATVIGLVLWALVPGFIAKNKGRSFWGFYLLSFIITPLISMIIALCVKKEIPEVVKENNTYYVHTVVEVPAFPDNNAVLPKDSNNSIDNCSDSRVPAENVPMLESPIEEKGQILFCRKCGARLQPDSRFCSNCGTEIVR